MQNDWWQWWADQDTSRQIDLERKRFVLRSFTIVGGAIVLAFGLAASTDQPILKAGLIGASLLFYCNLLALKFHGNVMVAVSITGMGIIAMVLVIVYTGGYKNTALYWTYPFPLTIFIFFGYRLGFLFNLLLFLAIGLLIFTPENTLANYRVEEVSRYFAAYAVTVVLSFIGEYFRSQSHSQLSKLTVEKLKMANTDDLTGLPNRRFIDSIYLPLLKERSDVLLPMTVAIVDIDHFKSINDQLGHDAGDKVLQHISNQLRAGLRDTDIIARIGGEEFVIALPKLTQEHAFKVLDNLRSNVASVDCEDIEQTAPVTVSIGFESFAHYEQFYPALKRADDKLYQAKRGGRNQVC